jgi:hypothetical protein
VVTDDDPETARLRALAIAAAERRAKEQADLVRRITGTPKGAPGSDDEPRASTQRPQRSRFGFDLDLNI